MKSWMKLLMNVSMNTWMMAMFIVSALPARADMAAVEIDSLEELAAYAARSGHHLRMKPGTYEVTKTYAEDPKVIFHFSGSNNRFDLTGVTLRIDTTVHASMPLGNAHEHSGFLVDGDHIEFNGGVFEDIGEHAAPRGLDEFKVLGNDNTFKGCRIIIRGSSPYGYGDLYGKGRGAATRLQKHCAMSVRGDRTLIDDCDFKVYAFGHGIHIHGAQDTVVRDVTMEGALRLTDEIYREKSGLAAKYDHKMMYPPWLKGRPIPKGKMLSLTEDGIRAYLDGADREGNNRRTGHITVENCLVKRMRGGITITMARSGTVTDCVVLESGGHAYSIPPNGVVRDCKGDAAFSPLLSMPYSNRGDADIELELVAAREEMGDHPLAKIVGNGHRIKITGSGDQKPGTLRPIVLGTTGDRYTVENTEPKALRRHNAASHITLVNETLHPVHLTGFASNNEVTTRGRVKDDGADNEQKKPLPMRADSATD